MAGSMMKTVVVKVKNGTTMETLRGPLDLRKFGVVQVRRSSEILFDEEAQMFYIKMLEPELQHLNDNLSETFFDTYELAVDHEIELINTARKLGVL
jgi:hypothetical protein